MQNHVRKRRAQISSVAGALNFFGLWIKRPLSIGAVAPSSEFLAEAMARDIDFQRPGAIVELGGGTGSITRALVRGARHPSEIVVIEREGSLCARLKRRFPGVRVINGDARDLPRLLRGAGVERVKAVVSGLPLMAFSPRQQYGIVRQAMAVLEPDGVMLQFTYGLTSPVRPSTAERIGILGRRSGYVVRNLPPATLWQYRRDAAAMPPVDIEPNVEAERRSA